MGQRISPWIPLKTIQELTKIPTSSHSLDQIFRRPKMMKPRTIQWRLPTAKSWDKQPLPHAVFLLLLLFWGAFPPLLTKSFSKTLAKWKWKWSPSVCPTLCDPMDSSLPGSAVHGIFQAKILEWAAISFSRGSSQPRDQTWVSCVGDRRFTVWATNPSTTSHFSFSWCSLKYLLLLISPSYSDPLQFSAPTLSCPQIRTVLPVSVPQAPSQV